MTAPTILIETASDKGGPGLVDVVIAILTFMGAAVWPVAFIVALWWFREPLKAKINEAHTLEGFGMKLLLTDVLGRAKAIESRADIQDPPDTLDATGTSHDLEAEGLTSDAPELGHPHLNVEPPSFERLAAVSPETAILYLWGQVEENLLSLAQVHNFPLGKRGVSRLIEYLDASDYLPTRLTSVIRDLYRVRNSAAHPNGMISYSRDEVQKFRDAAEIVVKELDELVTQGI